MGNSNTPLQVLITDPIADSGIAILEAAGLAVQYMPEPHREQLQEVLGTVHGWIVRSGTQVTAEDLTRATRLQVIGRAGVGVDNIDLPAATRHGVVVMNTPDVNTISAAEHTVGMMLALSRNISIAHQGLNRGEWNRHALVGTELRGKTLGIIGLGKIGREVLKRCRAFEMKILGYDPYIRPDMFHQEEVTLTDLDTLLRESDYVTLHIPLREETRNLIDLSRLKIMKPTARLINVARGGIVNETDLATALKEQIIAGAAIDVFSREPIPADHPLLNLPNCVLTPHLGASTREAKEGVSRAICEQVRDYLLEGKLTNVLNTPIADMALLQQLQPYLELAELLGKLQGQLVEGAVLQVQVECAGLAEAVKPVTLAFLIGLLQDQVTDRLNFVNAETVAVERGILVEQSYSTIRESYTNLIRTRVRTADGETLLVGSVFEGNRPRVVNVLGYELELTPKGTMLFIQNRDVPGVVGKVGSILGAAGINIGAYLLSRHNSDGDAFGVIRVDSRVADRVLAELSALPEIVSLRQVAC
jgi:D-3-phosphoglycerate dehydrogenase